MKREIFVSKRASVPRLLGSLLVLLAVMSMLACVAAVPDVVNYKYTNHHTATVQVDAKADEVYHTALRLVEEDPDLKLLERDDEKLLVEAEKGELHASVAVAPLGDKQAQVVVTADAGDKEEDKELALRIITSLCDRLEVKYTVVEK